MKGLLFYQQPLLCNLAFLSVNGIWFKVKTAVFSLMVLSVHIALKRQLLSIVKIAQLCVLGIINKVEEMMPTGASNSYSSVTVSTGTRDNVVVSTISTRLTTPRSLTPSPGLLLKTVKNAHRINKWKWSVITYWQWTINCKQFWKLDKKMVNCKMLKDVIKEWRVISQKTLTMRVRVVAICYRHHMHNVDNEVPQLPQT